MATANNVVVPDHDAITADAEDWLNIEASLFFAGDRDYFRFTLGQQATLFIDMDSQDVGLSTSLDGVVDVYDSSGMMLLGSNNQGYDFRDFVAPITPTSSAASPDPALAIDLTAGTYLVRVTSFLNMSSGDYQLRLLTDSSTSSSQPAFSSRPGAGVTLFLDFDGHSATDSWGTYTASPYDLNGQPNAISPAERLAINNLWQIVAEDFAPFDVNITTVDPASFGDGVGYRMVITNSVPGVVGLPDWSRGGALTGSFNGPATNTGFVFANSFSDYLGGISGRMVASTIEQGNETSRQFAVSIGLKNYGGSNSQPTGIMQLPRFGLSRATWSAGPTHSGELPVTIQDDVAALTAPGGIAYAPDDFGDTLATSTLMTSTSVQGIIGHRLNDKDILRVPATQADYTVNVFVEPYFGNVDVELRIYDANGGLLITGDPTEEFGLTATVYVAVPNDYYFEVISDGEPGEIGSYTLSYTPNAVTAPVHVNTITINAGAAQRSSVTELDLRFSRPVTFPNGPNAGISLLGPSGAVNLDIDLTGSTPSLTKVHVTFPNGSGGFKSLEDGKYTLLFSSNNIIDDGGNKLDGDNDGQPGGDYSFGLYRLYGDVDGDHTVSSMDFAVFRTVFGASGTTGLIFALDFSANGVVDAEDFARLRTNFGLTIQP